MQVKLCPHCGGTACLNASYGYRTLTYFIYVKCDICGATGKTYTSATDPAIDNWENSACIDAVKAWNMRTTERKVKDAI